jgi:hypothetical protein
MGQKTVPQGGVSQKVIDYVNVKLAALCKKVTLARTGTHTESDRYVMTVDG